MLEFNLYYGAYILVLEHTTGTSSTASSFSSERVSNILSSSPSKEVSGTNSETVREVTAAISTQEPKTDQLVTLPPQETSETHPTLIPPQETESSSQATSDLSNATSAESTTGSSQATVIMSQTSGSSHARESKSETTSDSSQTTVSKSETTGGSLQAAVSKSETTSDSSQVNVTKSVSSRPSSLQGTQDDQQVTTSTIESATSGSSHISDSIPNLSTTGRPTQPRLPPPPPDKEINLPGKYAIYIYI